MQKLAVVLTGDETKLYDVREEDKVSVIDVKALCPA